VLHEEGPMLVLAGPGSGKTRVVTHRIARLLSRGVPPEAILALTFTNKAADEMKARVERLAPGANVWIGTFHRFCCRLLRRHASLVGLSPNFSIYDSDDSRRLLKQVLEGQAVSSAMFPVNLVAHGISKLKNDLVLLERFAPRTGDPLGAILAKVYPEYQKRLLAANAVDFDDLLMHVGALLIHEPELRADLDERFRYVMVDEYQDTNLAQYIIVRSLSMDVPNLAVTGDPDQSIYGWRGANLSNILGFEDDYPQALVVRLEQNYRSTRRILEAADALIRHNRKRKPKALFTENDEGRPVRLVRLPNESEEARWVAARIAHEIRAGRRRPRDFAVFYRVNALSRAIESALKAEAIPHQIVSGMEFFARQEIKDLMAYLSLSNNPQNDLAFERVVNVPARGIGKATLGRLRARARELGTSLVSAAESVLQAGEWPKKTAQPLSEFIALIHRIGRSSDSVEMILNTVLEETQYQRALENVDTPESQERVANVQELLTAARQFDRQGPYDAPLETFLEANALRNETDDFENSADCVTLMTLHASKGLEFPCVTIIALEEGLIPHERCKKDPLELEEERRLLFVAMTRAKEELDLSYVHRREFRGASRFTLCSSFIPEFSVDSLIHDDLCRTDEAPPRQAFEDEPWDEACQLAHAPAPPAASGGTGAQKLSFSSLTTAAELAGGGQAGPSIDPDEFMPGLVVRHPDYGLGRVLSTSGEGPLRRVVVRFTSAAGERSFVVAKSALRPVRAG
jgi:DNA helicase-2/ATP-dependent DNA helicase PcrA